MGLTYVALSADDGLEACEEHHWQGTRLENQESSAEAALGLLYAYLSERHPPVA